MEGGASPFLPGGRRSPGGGRRGVCPQAAADTPGTSGNTGGPWPGPHSGSCSDPAGPTPRAPAQSSNHGNLLLSNKVSVSKCPPSRFNVDKQEEC